MIAVQVRNEDDIDRARIYAEALHGNEGRRTTVDQESGRGAFDVKTRLITAAAAERVAAAENS